MENKEKTSLEKHKENYGYSQYNRLAKREWFHKLDKVLNKLKATDSAVKAIEEEKAKTESEK